MFASRIARSRLHGRVLHHVAHVQGVRVAGHHVRPAGVAGRPRPHDVAHRADDVRLDLAQLREGRQARIGARPVGEPAAHLRARAPRGSATSVTASPVEPQTKHDARVIRSRTHVRAEAARLGGRPGAAVERRRQPALGVRERDEDLLLRAAGLRQPAERLLELVLAELDRERADDRHRDQRRAGQHLLSRSPTASGRARTPRRRSAARSGAPRSTRDRSSAATSARSGA